MSEPERIIAARSEGSASVAADAGPGKLESGLDVLLAHHVINRKHPSGFCLRDKIERGVSRIFVELFGDVGDRTALEFRVVRILRVDQNHVLPAAGCFDDVPPARRAGDDFLLETDANFWIGEAFEES